MNMFEFYFIVFWPQAGGLVLGLLLALAARRNTIGVEDRTARGLATGGAALALLVAIVPTVLGVVNMQTQLQIPGFLWANNDSPVHYAIPLCMGILATALMLCAPLPKSTDAEADLTPRSLRSFTSLGSLAVISVLAAGAVAIAIAAGRASIEDDAGHLRMYRIDSGVVAGATEIYGWYYSVPALITLAILLVLTLVTLGRITRPSLGSNAVQDTAIRKNRSSVVTGFATAALLLHLGYIGVFLAGTASLKIGGRDGANGTWVNSWTEFAALEPALQATGRILQLVGIAIWAYIFFQSMLGERKIRY